MAMASDDMTPLWDPATKRFDPRRLRQAMVARKLTPKDMVEKTGLVETTIYRARRGEAVDDSTAIAIYEALDQTEPMSIVRNG